MKEFMANAIIIRFRCFYVIQRDTPPDTFRLATQPKRQHCPD